MAAVVYFCSKAGRAEYSTPLSSDAVILVVGMEQTGQEAYVRVVRDKCFYFFFPEEKRECIYARYQKTFWGQLEATFADRN